MARADTDMGTIHLRRHLLRSTTEEDATRTHQHTVSDAIHRTERDEIESTGIRGTHIHRLRLRPEELGTEDISRRTLLLDLLRMDMTIVVELHGNLTLSKASCWRNINEIVL